MSAYPLVLIIFKRKLLAFLTTLLFALNASSFGSLEYAVKGVDYLAIAVMNIFFISYYYLINRKDWELKQKSFLIIKSIFLGILLSLILIYAKLLILPFIILTLIYFTKKYTLNIIISTIITSIILFIALMLSPIRIYPVLILIPLIEIFLFLNKKTFTSLTESLTRLILFYTPFILLLLLHQSSSLSFLNRAQENWHLIVTPFIGLGYLILPYDFLDKFLFTVKLYDFKPYIQYSFLSFSAFITIFTIPIAILLSKKPIKFYIKLIITNFIFYIPLFFIITDFLKTNNYPGIQYYIEHIPPYYLIGIYLIILATTYLFENWNKKNDLAISSIWIGPLIAFIFIFSTWLLSGPDFIYTSSIHWYLVIPSLFISFFMAGLITRIYDLGINKWSKVIYVFITIYLTIFFIINRNQIYHHFMSNDNIGRGAYDQIVMQKKILELYTNKLNKEDTLFYFDTDYANARYYSETILQAFPYWMHILRSNNYPSGCIAYLINSEKDPLKLGDFIEKKGNSIKFKSSSYCVKGRQLSVTQFSEIDLDNIYAFRIRDKQIKDSKEEFLKIIENNP